MSNQLQVTGTAIFSAAGQSLQLTSASDVYLNVTRGASILNIGIDATSAFYNTNTSHKFYTNSGTINALTLGSTGIATFSGAGNRPVFIDSNVNIKADAGGWAMQHGFIGSSNTNRGGFGANGSADTLNYYYVGIFGSEKLKIDYTTGAAIYSSSVDATQFSSIGRGTSFGYKLPDWQIYNTTSGNRLAFSNYSADLLTITSGGNVLIGTTTDNGARLQINGTSNFTGNLTINDGSLIKLGQGGSSNVSIDFFASNFGAGYEGRIMGLNSDGNTHFYSRNGSATFTDIGYFSNTGMYITYYGTYSDMRLKNLIEINPDINLDGLDVIKYTLKSNPSLIRYGYSAQQVQSVLPDLVTLNKGIGQSDEDATLMLNYNDLYVLKIAALEKKMAELMQEVAVLKGKNN